MEGIVERMKALAEHAEQSEKTELDLLKQTNPDIVGMSAMLTTTMLSMQDTASMIRQDDAIKDIKIMIGGAPANPDVATEMGANYSADASSAVDLAVSLVA